MLGESLFPVPVARAPRVGRVGHPMERMMGKSARGMDVRVTYPATLSCSVEAVHQRTPL